MVKRVLTKEEKRINRESERAFKVYKQATEAYKTTKEQFHVVAGDYNRAFGAYVDELQHPPAGWTKAEWKAKLAPKQAKMLKLQKLWHDGSGKLSKATVAVSDAEKKWLAIRKKR